MTTALDMIPALNSRVLVRCESMQIECTVKNVKNSWGKPRLLVTPVTGTGEQWVEMERVTVPQCTATKPGVCIFGRESGTLCHGPMAGCNDRCVFPKAK